MGGIGFLLHSHLTHAPPLFIQDIDSDIQHDWKRVFNPHYWILQELVL